MEDLRLCVADRMRRVKHRASVLIVEDDPIAMETYVHALKAERYDVRAASDAESGLTEIASTTPAAVLLDLHLPVADGVEFLRRLRATAHAHLPVAVMTGDYQVEERVVYDLEMLGAHLYFKPLWVEDIIRIVHELVPSP